MVTSTSWCHSKSAACPFELLRLKITSEKGGPKKPPPPACWWNEFLRLPCPTCQPRLVGPWWCRISGRQTQDLYTYGHPFQDMQSIKPLSIPLIKGLLQDLASSRLMMKHYWSGFRKRVWNFQLSRIDVGLQTGQQRSVQSVYSVYFINLRIF